MTEEPEVDLKLEVIYPEGISSSVEDDSSSSFLRQISPCVEFENIYIEKPEIEDLSKPSLDHDSDDDILLRRDEAGRISMTILSQSRDSSTENITFFPPFSEDAVILDDSVTDEAAATTEKPLSIISTASRLRTYSHSPGLIESVQALRTRSQSAASFVDYGRLAPDSPSAQLRTASFSSGKSSMFTAEGLHLHGCVARRDYQAVRDILVQMPRLVKACDEFGCTVLHTACEAGDLAMVDLLIQHNADIDARDARQRTCLHMSIDAPIVRLLCEEGANIALADKNGYHPLHIFTADGNVDCVRILLEYGADPMLMEPILHRSSIHIAADVGDFNLLSALVLCSRHPVDVNTVDVDGNTPLQLVSHSTVADGQQQRSIMLLLDNGSSVEQPNARGISSLHYACGNRHFGMTGIAEPIVQVFLEMGADPNAPDHDNCTPLIIACAHREWGICKALLEAGGDMNIPCPMSSYMLQEGFGRDANAANMIELSDCTASDLMQRQIRRALFSYISVPQTKIPIESRDRCMHCASTFEEALSTSLSTSSFPFTLFKGTGRYHCRLCCRVLCVECASQSLSREAMPQFIADTCSDSMFRLCGVCFDVLTTQT